MEWKSILLGRITLFVRWPTRSSLHVKRALPQVDLSSPNQFLDAARIHLVQHPARTQALTSAELSQWLQTMRPAWRCVVARTSSRIFMLTGRGRAC